MPLLDVVIVCEGWAKQFMPAVVPLKELKEKAIEDGGFIQYSKILPTLTETTEGHPEDMNECPPNINPFLRNVS